MSSFQIDLSPNFAADAACLLNVTPDHLDRHGTLENYASVKARLLESARPDATLAIGVDTAPSAAIAERLIQAGRKVVGISVERLVEGGLYVRQGRLIDNRAGLARHLADLARFDRLPGLHNAQNIAIAFAALSSLGLPDDAILAAIGRFPGLAHRLETIADHHGVRLVNDSKATNADATAHALSSFAAIHWIVGGRPKQGGISGLLGHLASVRHAYLIGESQAEFAASLDGHVPITRAGTIDAALDAALAKAQAGEVILLSPAAASFDQFSDFEARGDHFRALVKERCP